MAVLRYVKRIKAIIILIKGKTNDRRHFVEMREDF